MDTGTFILILSFGTPIIIIVFIFFFIKRGFRKGSRFAEELRRRIAAARPATAIVITAQSGMVGGSINRIIHLTLEVHDDLGSPYTTRATWFVDSLHFDLINGGNTINVRVDAQNKNVIYPAETWAKYTEGYENL